jgi:glycosyltransferase involved in cell wall biosynthesis
MPFSSHSGKHHIKNIIKKLAPKSGIDIGVGCGTYAELFPEIEWDGVEVWKPYIDKYNLKEKYKNLFVEDARKWKPKQHYDVAILGDVLEHMTKKDALALALKMAKCSDTTIVSIPIGYYPQDEFEGNPYEKHVTDHWTHEEVIATFGVPQWSRVDNEIGVYVWSKHINISPLKIAVYAIAKNEAHFIPRFCESAKDADLILIADTGSDDGLPEEAEKYGAQVHHICITPWRFDLARNAALALIPRDVDVCISLDIDEVLQPGWREEIERVWEKGKTTRLRYMFDWGSGILFYGEKIHAKHGYMWHHPCHEHIRADGRITEVGAHTEMLLAVHLPDPTKSRGQYLDLLELSVKEDPNCPRNAFYYARELSFHARWQDCIDAVNRYLALPQATWYHERCYAYRTAARCWNALGNFYEAEKTYMLATAEASNTREPWCELALLMYQQQKWEECFAYAMRTLRITDREMVYTCDPVAWGDLPHDLASISAYHLGIKDIAVQQALLAVEKAPDDLRLKQNLQYLLNESVDN